MSMIVYTRRKKRERKIFVTLDLKKAFDSISRVELFNILRNRAQNKNDHHLINLIINLNRCSYL